CSSTSTGTWGTANNQFRHPYAVACAGTTLYIADTSNNRLCVYDTNLNFLAKWYAGFLKTPKGVALDPQGRIYVTTQGTGNVQIFTDASGAPTTAFGSPGSGNGQFNGGWGIAVDGNGNIYVADTGNNRVEKFDPYPALTYNSTLDPGALG